MVSHSLYNFGIVAIRSMFFKVLLDTTLLTSPRVELSNVWHSALFLFGRLSKNSNNILMFKPYTVYLMSFIMVSISLSTSSFSSSLVVT